MTHGFSSVYPVLDGSTSSDNRYKPQTEGISLREYFAGLALQGLLSSPTTKYDQAAILAVNLANDLILTLNK